MNQHRHTHTHTNTHTHTHTDTHTTLKTLPRSQTRHWTQHLEWEVDVLSLNSYLLLLLPPLQTFVYLLLWEWQRGSDTVRHLGDTPVSRGTQPAGARTRWQRTKMNQNHLKHPLSLHCSSGNETLFLHLSVSPQSVVINPVLIQCFPPGHTRVRVLCLLCICPCDVVVSP